MSPTGHADDARVPRVLWTPSADAMRTTDIGRFAAFAAGSGAGTAPGFSRGAGPGLLADYDALWRWSVADIDRFWSTLWQYMGVRAEGDLSTVRVGERMDTTRWFPGSRLNYAEHALAGRPDDAVAILGHGETRDPVVVTWGELRAQVARARAGLLRLGVTSGERVVAYLPNVPEAIVAMLACASIGAVWASCPPEFGVRAVIDRFGQIEPVVLVAADGYRYGGRVVDRRSEVEEIRGALPSLRATVSLSYAFPAPPPRRGTIQWDALLAEEAPLVLERVPFDHPLYVLFSSGTTGLPKAIVHGHGGILLAHLRDLRLHHDLGAQDRLLWFTTTGWMMWNYLVSGLLAGAAVVCFDGNPTHDGPLTLWRVAAETATTCMGASAPFLMACRRSGATPGEELDLSALRSVGSTGAPLPAEGYAWFYDHVRPDIPLASISGGTDVCSIFVGHAPIVPVWEGEISCRALGADVHAFDGEGRPVVGRQGELVVTQPLPSMPVGLWGDADGSRYRQTYFETFPGVWRHGDWITLTERGSCIIGGRSDATLNRGGVRLGTAEIYGVVESTGEVADSLVVHREDRDGGPGELLLFVVLAPGVDLDDRLRSGIVARIRHELSPRHVPDRIVQVPAVPRTLSGKKLEVPVKRILAGEPTSAVMSIESLADPTAVQFFERWASASPTGCEP
ncbi:MAG: acetoacetate--CoA ligase [Actinomycetota bacterium]|nr:acetoacetate--CoA ligase [Actinomycetota bacterium]